MWSKLKKLVGQWQGILITAPTVAVLVIASNFTGLFQLLEWATLDQFFCLRPQESISKRVIIVTYDESDLRKIGNWPFSDALLADLIEKLEKQKPRAIGLDIYRNLPVEPGHAKLLSVFEAAPNLVGVEKALGNAVPPSPTLQRLDKVALADLLLDADGKVRRSLLSFSEQGQVKLSLGARLALIYLLLKLNLTLL